MGRIKEQMQQEAQIAPVAPRRTIKDLITGNWNRIAAVAPRQLDPNRLLSLCLSTINKVPHLAECTPESLLSCFMRCSALGLEPSDVDGLGRAYIIPFYNTSRQVFEATFIVGYAGIIDLARRSGEIKDINARAVYEGEEFSYEFGLHEDIRHRPPMGQSVLKTPDKLTHVYLVCNFANGGQFIDVMTKDEIEAVRKRSKSAGKGPWVTDYEKMAEKTIIRRSKNYLPLSVEAKDALAADETSGGYEYIFRPQIVEAEAMEVPKEEPKEAPKERKTKEQPKETPQEPPKSGNTGKAACATCGRLVNASPDATLDDLNVFQCCEKPDYRWV